MSARAVAIAALCGAVFTATGLRALGQATAPAQQAQADPRELLIQADGKMRRGLYEDAARLYERARPAPGSAAAYNRACALLKAGKQEEAEAALKDVVAGTDDPGMAASAAFNLGRSLRTRGAGEQDGAARLRMLEAAEGAFRACVDAAPGDRDGARALELTRREIKALRDQAEKQKHEAEQQRQDEQKRKDEQRKKDREDLADKLKDLADKQDAAEKKAGDDQQKAQNDPQQREEAQKDAEHEQRSVGQESRSAAKDLENQRKAEQGGSGAMDKAQGAMKGARDAQDAAERSLGEGDYDGARQQQKQAAEKLREAAGSVEESAKEEQKGSKGGSGEDQAKASDAKRNGPEGNARPDQAKTTKPKKQNDPIAAKLLEREERDRPSRQRFVRSMQGAPTPVDKDW